MNFHIAAKFEIEKLTYIINFMKSDPKYSNQTQKLNSAQSSLNSAKSLLDSIGGAKYLPGQSEQVWQPIRNAEKIIKEVRRNSK